MCLIIKERERERALENKSISKCFVWIAIKKFIFFNKKIETPPFSCAFIKPNRTKLCYF